MLLLGERRTALDDDLIPTHAVVHLVVDQLVDVRIEEELVLFVVVLRTHAHCDCLVSQPVPHHCSEELVARPCDFQYSRASGS